MPLYQSGPSAPVHIRSPIPVPVGQVEPWAIAYANAASADAFFRQRMSAPYTVFDSKQVFDDSDLANSAENFPLLFDNQQVSGGSTSTAFRPNEASTRLSVGLNTAGVRVRQTRRRFNYQPGKSQVIILTGVLGAAATGITTELGYFDDNNGLFFRVDENGAHVVVRSYVSGAAVDTVIDQADWNIDKLNGAGASGITLDFSKTQIFVIDFEWLGVGTVRFGFFVNGTPVYCHYAHNANVNSTVYMSTPNLPVRARIANDGTGNVAYMDQICLSVISEGGLDPTGIVRGGDIGAAAAAGVSAGTVNTSYAVCGIRLKSNYLSADVSVSGLSMLETGNNNFLWRLHFNPTLTSGLTYSDVTRSAVQFGVGASSGDALTNQGIVISSGYVSRDTGSVTLAVDSRLKLGSLIDGTRDEIVLSATPLTQNHVYYGSLVWTEL